MCACTAQSRNAVGPLPESTGRRREGEEELRSTFTDDENKTSARPKRRRKEHHHLLAELLKQRVFHLLEKQCAQGLHGCVACFGDHRRVPRLPLLTGPSDSTLHGRSEWGLRGARLITADPIAKKWRRTFLNSANDEVLVGQAKGVTYESNTTALSAS